MMTGKKRLLKFVLPAVAWSIVFLAAPAAAQLDPATIPKWETALFVPPAMPNAGTIALDNGAVADYYEIAQRQFLQQVLPASMGLMTTVWGYGAINTPASFHWPSDVIEATVNRPVRVKWVNDLKAANGNFLPHLFAADIDTQLHWANPPRECADNTTRTDCNGTGNDYVGPVPMVVHLHGSHVNAESDGFPEAWYLPAANNIPAGYATRGSDFNQVAGAPNEAGAAYFQYRNDQRATTLWFHDHSLGITRLNIYAGPVGFYLLRGGPDDVAAGVLPAGAFEIPLVIQRRAFHNNGALDFTGFGGANDVTVVNGNTWPFLEVQARRYRFRLLNADNQDPIDLYLATAPNVGAALDNAFWWIGADGGFLPAPQNVTNVPMHIAERADVIVDFTGRAGQTLYLVNGEGNAGTTEEVLQFRVVAATPGDTTTAPGALNLAPFFHPLGPADVVLKVSVNDGILAGKQLGTVADNGAAVPLLWDDAVTESIPFDNVAIWQIHNFDGGDHPIHIHMVQFEILGTRPLGSPDNTPLTPPGPGQTGTKDTIFLQGDVIVHVKARFDIGGQFVWHCHILDHEDDEMMRPYDVVGGPEPPPPPPPPGGGGGGMTFFGSGGGGGGCAMVASKGDINDLAGAYGALVLVALGLAFRRRLKRRER